MVGGGRWEVGGGRWEVGGGKWEVGGGRWEVGSGIWEVGFKKNDHPKMFSGYGGQSPYPVIHV